MNKVNDEEALKQFQDKARAFLLNGELRELDIKRLEEIGYFTAPASIRHHLNWPGGLALHSINVTRNLLTLKAFKSPASAYRVGMLHDIVKCLCYRMRKNGSYGWKNTGYPGHGVASAQICADLGISLLPEERAAITWHMGVYGMNDDQMKEHQAACLKWPREIIYTHAADNLASVLETLDLPNEEEDEDEN